jgi:hypothetical protein
MRILKMYKMKNFPDQECSWPASASENSIKPIIHSFNFFRFHRRISIARKILTMLKSSLLSSLLATTALAGPLTKRGAWTAPVGGKWQIVISGTPDINTPNVPVWDVDLFNTDESVIASLKSAGKKVICYFSAGTSEPDRPDGSQIRSEERGAGLPEWPGENWLDLRSENIWNIMKARIALASKKGCDAVDPDNMGI